MQQLNTHLAGMPHTPYQGMNTFAPIRLLPHRLHRRRQGNYATAPSCPQRHRLHCMPSLHSSRSNKTGSLCTTRRLDTFICMKNQSKNRDQDGLKQLKQERQYGVWNKWQCKERPVALSMFSIMSKAMIEFTCHNSEFIH